jgi:hypothetical protein
LSSSFVPDRAGNAADAASLHRRPPDPGPGGFFMRERILFAIIGTISQ